MQSVSLKLVTMGVGIAFLLMAAGGSKTPPGKVLLQRSCTACHSLDAIQARRLSREDWSLELDKMISMGAKVRNRKALLDYLAATYGASK
ncbi:MAG: hypothetical protein JWO80_2258 [Bryobacterales bacterium]|nr:hypothetical protein [Bryobacterales bacterium]